MLFIIDVISQFNSGYEDSVERIVKTVKTNSNLLLIPLVNMTGPFFLPVLLIY